MSRPTARLVLPLVILAAIAVSYCGDATPTAPDQELSLSADRASKPPKGPDPPPATGLTATELLSDPLLHSMLGSLRDEVGAEAITSAIEATRVSLADGDAEAARAHLEDTYAALASYLSTGGVHDEDVIHLDAAELFLDEVEALIDTGGSRGKKKDT